MQEPKAVDASGQPLVAFGRLLLNRSKQQVRTQTLLPCEPYKALAFPMTRGHSPAPH